MATTFLTRCCRPAGLGSHCGACTEAWSSSFTTTRCDPLASNASTWPLLLPTLTRLASQVGGTSLEDYLSCAYGPDEDTDRFTLSVFAVRDPIDRFVSAVGEVLQRVVNGVCPRGRCPPIDKDQLRKSTEWYPIAERARFNFSAEVLPKLMAAFVADTTCCHAGYGRDHFAPQVTFATYADRGVDMLLRLDAIEEGLDDLTRRLPPSRSTTCRLEHANSAQAKPGNVADSVALRGALDDSLVRQLCDVYAQDFTCFDLPRPAVCASQSRGTSDSDAKTEDSSAILAAPTPPSPGLSPVERKTPLSNGNVAVPEPLATVMVLTCNRPKYVLLALRQIANQDYRPLEVLVVDDGSTDLEPLLRAAYPDLEVSKPDGREESATPTSASPRQGAPSVGGLAVRLISLPRRASIGAKRTAAVHAALGDVILHWDDDDFHEPTRIREQVAPIVRGDAELTALELSFVVTLPQLSFYEVDPERTTILWSSLAYRSSLGRELGFANVSLAEDIHFADRAVRACHRMAVVRGVQSIYTRHESAEVSNTFQGFHVQGMLRQNLLRTSSPPGWLTPELAADARSAESDADGRACPVVEWHRPDGFVPAQSTVPLMAPRCCATPTDTSCAWRGGAQSRQRRSRQLMHYGVEHECTSGPMRLTRAASKRDTTLLVDAMSCGLVVGSTVDLGQEMVTVKGFGSILLEESLQFPYEVGHAVTDSSQGYTGVWVRDRWGENPSNLDPTSADDGTVCLNDRKEWYGIQCGAPGDHVYTHHVPHQSPPPPSPPPPSPSPPPPLPSPPPPSPPPPSPPPPSPPPTPPPPSPPP